MKLGGMEEEGRERWVQRTGRMKEDGKVRGSRMKKEEILGGVIDNLEYNSIRKEIRK